jgi:hypothetical protein
MVSIDVAKTQRTTEFQRPVKNIHTGFLALPSGKEFIG